MLYPNMLRENDVVAICAPASPVNKKLLEKPIEFLQSIGLQVILAKNVYEKNDYLAGTDEQRIEDFHTLIKDEKVKAIFFARGGYGTARITPLLKIDLIRQHPKIIWGFSDTTFLLNTIFQQAQLIVFHGPMMSSIHDHQNDNLTKQQFNQLFDPALRTYDESIAPLNVLLEGEATGRIVGGNLTVIMSSIGTPYEIDLAGKILLIEDIDEEVYKIDRMLNQLKQTNKLKELTGVVIGHFHDQVPKDYRHHEGVYEKNDSNEKDEQPSDAKANQQRDTDLQNVFLHYFQDLHIPVVSGFKIGHTFPNFAIPIGAHAKLSTKHRQLIIEPGIK